MATYYVDPAATGLNDGSSWTDAFIDLQSAVTACVGSGNIIYARGTQTLSSLGTASIDFGSAASGVEGNYNKIIGCNASGDNDGTYFVLDGEDTNGAGLAGIYWRTATYWYIENVRVTRSQGDGFGGTNAYAPAWKIIHCKADLNYVYGFNGNGSASASRFVAFCVAKNNGSHGFRNLRDSWQVFCVSDGNVVGFYGYGERYYGCVCCNNSQQGIYCYGGGAFRCVSDDNGSNPTQYGISLGYTGAIGIENRCTNNYGYGLAGVAAGIALFNFCSGNFGVQISPDIVGFLFGNVTEGTQGYVDAANGDYNLTADAAMRRVAVTLPS